MSNTYTQNITLLAPGVGDAATTNSWGGLINNDLSLIDSAIAGQLSLSVAGNTNVILTSSSGAADQERNQDFVFTGALTGSISVFWPQNQTRSFSVFNNTSGSFTLTCAVNNGSGVAAGTTIAIPQGYRAQLVSDGTNITTRGIAVVPSKLPSVANSITLAGTDGKTLTVSNSLTLAGNDATTLTFQGTDTYVGRATTDTLTNKTLTSPVLTAPTLGVASATSINFGGTALSHYDEGTWTPADASGGSVTYANVTATYTRTGRMVFAFVAYTVNATASGATNLVGGLPFTANNIANGSFPAARIITDAATNADSAVVNAGTTQFQIVNQANSSAATNAQMSGHYVRAWLIYYI